MNPACGGGVCVATVVTGQVTTDDQPPVTINVTADIFYPESAPMNGMSIVGVHGGWCNGFTGSWTPVAQHLALNGWVVMIPHYRGDNATDPPMKCPPDPNSCDVGCEELQDLRNAACFLKNHFNTCSRLCSGGSCLDPDLVFGWGHSAGGNRVVMTEARYPGTFKRIATTGGGLNGRLQYERLNDCSPASGSAGWREVVDAILNNASDPGTTDLDFAERDALRNIDAITPDCPGEVPYMTGLIGFNGYRDTAVPVESLDTFMDALDDAQFDVITHDPQNAVNSQKHVYCEADHNWWQGSLWDPAPTEDPYEQRALETVNSIIRFFKDEQGATNDDKRLRQPVKVYLEEPEPFFGAEDGKKRYHFKAWVCNTGYDDTLELDVEHQIFPLRGNCIDSNGDLKMPTEICGRPGVCLDGGDCNADPLQTNCYPCPGSCAPVTAGWVDDVTLAPGACREVHKWRDLSGTVPSGPANFPPIPIRHDVVVRVDHDPGHSRACPPSPDCHVGVPDEIYTTESPCAVGGGTPDRPVCEILGRFSDRFVLRPDFAEFLDPQQLDQAAAQY